MSPSKKKGPAIDTKKQWEMYFSALKKQEWPKAIASLNALKEAEPDNPNVYLKIGDLLQRTGDVPSAITAYHQAAWHILNSGFHHKAIAIYKVILRLDPYDVEATNKSKELLMEMELSKSSSFAALEETREAPAEGEIPLGPAEEPLSPEPAEGPAVHPSETFGSAEWPAPETTETTLCPPEGLWELDTGRYEEKPLKEEMPSLFTTLSKGQVDEIINNAEILTYEDGQAVIEEGDSGDSMFVIKEGRAKVIAHILGKTIELATLQTGDVFGEVAFLTGRPRTASVIAMGRLRAVEINRVVLEDVIEKNPQILDKLQDFYQSRVQDTIKKVKGSKDKGS